MVLTGSFALYAEFIECLKYDPIQLSVQYNVSYINKMFKDYVFKKG